MDEIERGYITLIKKVESLGQELDDKTEKVKKNDAALLGRMAEITGPVIRNVGLNLLKKGKQDNKGELYDTVFHEKKMIVLGKTDPVPFRPDDIKKKVDDQFCVLSEEGKLYEMMFSSDGFLVDSYLNPISPEDALLIYGYDVMIMLYRAMHDYMKNQEELISALEKIIAFTFPH